MDERREQARLRLRFPVTHILGEDEQHVCRAEDLSVGGIRIAGARGDGWRRSRFAWLQFRLPGPDGAVIRALGELKHEAAGEGGDEARGYHIKYIYPRDRRRYEAFVRSQAAG